MTLPQRPRVLLADDHRIVAEGLKNILEAEFELVGIVEDGRALVSATRRLRPDVIVADIGMPELNGIEALAQLRREFPSIKVVFLTMHTEVAYAHRAMEGGALGYVLKHAASSELITAVRAALNGKTYLTPALAGSVLQSIQQRSELVPDPVATLTPRQREILQLFAEGGSAKEIGGKLGISPRTVEFHKYQMMASLGVHHSAELVHLAIKYGLVGN